MKKILIIRLSSLGDIVLTSSTTLNFKINYPQAEIVFLTRERFVSLAGSLPGVDRVVGLSEPVSALSLFRDALSLDDSGFDLVVDLHANLRSALLRNLITSSQTIVYRKNRLLRERMVRGKNVTLPVPTVTVAYNETLRQLNPQAIIASHHPLLSLEKFDGAINSADSANHYQAKLQALSEAGKSLVFLAPGARHETKRAPLDLFAKVAQKIGELENTVIVCAFQSGEGNLSLAENLPSEKYLELVDTPLAELAQAIRLSEVTLSNDSGVAHLSSAVGTPTVALFGPTHSALGFSPGGFLDRVIEVDEPCRPCSLHGSKPCYREQRFCFERIEVEKVSAALIEILHKRAERRPVLFLDRDGVVIREKRFLSDPREVELIPGVANALAAASRAGYALVVISNQSGVARGMFTVEDVERVNERLTAMLENEGVSLDSVRYSPYHAEAALARYRSPDGGRKPSDELFVAAAREHNLDLRTSWMIGDRATDFLAARPLGGRSALVRTGYGRQCERELEKYLDLPPDLICDDLPAAIERILKGQI